MVFKKKFISLQRNQKNKRIIKGLFLIISFNYLYKKGGVNMWEKFTIEVVNVETSEVRQITMADSGTKNLMKFLIDLEKKKWKLMKIERGIAN